MTTNDKPVCWQCRVLFPDGTWSDWFDHESEDSRDRHAEHFKRIGHEYETRDLYDRPQPAAPQVPERWRDAVADEYLDAIEKAGDILGQAADGETLHEACARVVAERDALLEMNAAQAATIARIQSDGLHVATLHRHPARGELRVEYADDVTELPDGDYKILAYKATDIRGDTCHFGVESTARAWAKSGSVEAVHVRQLRALATPPAPEQPKPAGDDVGLLSLAVGYYTVAREPRAPEVREAFDRIKARLAAKPAGDVEALIARLEAVDTNDTDCLAAAEMLRRLAAQPAQGEGEK